MWISAHLHPSSGCSNEHASKERRLLWHQGEESGAPVLVKISEEVPEAIKGLLSSLPAF